MRRTLAGILLLAALGCGPIPVRTLSTVLEDAQDARLETFEGLPVVRGRVIVKFRPGTFPAKEWQPSAFLGIPGAREISRYPEIQVIVLQAPLPVGEFIARLRNSERFVYVEPDAIVYGLKIPRDKYWTKDDYLWGLRKIGSEAAWNCTTGDPKIVVAVVDGGLDVSHSDLKNNLWTVPSNPATLDVEVAGIPRTCLAGDWGWDAIKRNTCKPGYSLAHGTHVAGTIGAEEGKNGVVGVNWDTKLMSVRSLEQNYGSIDDAVAAAEFVLKVKRKTAQEKDVWVANLSWGTYTEATALFDMLELLGKENIVMAAGAGNDGKDAYVTPFYPASYAVDIPQLISVAATRPDDLLPKFSNFGVQSIEIAAPGLQIGSAMPTIVPMKLDGTSMATAHVSGAAALVAAGCPGLNAAEIKTRLLNSADPIPATGIKIIGGRLNVATALKGCACGKQ